MIEEITTGKSEICKHMLDDLPEWFGLEDAKAKYVADVATLTMIIVREANEFIGFVALKAHNEFTTE